jgi:hypothetical protein
MWVGPSRAIYGQNVALALPVTSLLYAGVVYLGAIALAVLLAAVLGAERIWVAKKHTTRTALLWAEVASWIVVAFIANVLAVSVAFGRPGDPAWSPLVEQAYLILHVAVLGLAFRRLYGLLRGRWAPPTPDPRRATSTIRLLRAVAVLVIVVTQVPLAVLFGVLGPNPAKNTWPVTIVNAAQRRSMYLLHRDEKWVMGVDSESSKLIRVPLKEHDEIVFEPHDLRPQRTAAGRR